MIYPFRYNNNETSPALRFPDLAGRAFTFNIFANNLTYTVRVSYNVFTNNGQVSVFDQSQNPIIVNTPLIETFNGTQPNFLWNTNVFAGYYLVYDPGQAGFVFGAI